MELTHESGKEREVYKMYCQKIRTFKKEKKDPTSTKNIKKKGDLRG